MGKDQFDRGWNVKGHISDDAKTLYDRDWNVSGHISDDGKTIYDQNWNVVAHVSDDGKTVYDKDWNTSGHVSDDGKTIYDKNWDTSGRVTDGRGSYDQNWNTHAGRGGGGGEDGASDWHNIETEKHRSSGDYCSEPAPLKLWQRIFWGALGALILYGACKMGLSAGRGFVAMHGDLLGGIIVGIGVACVVSLLAMFCLQMALSKD